MVSSLPETFGLFFTPDTWPAVHRFSQFIGRPFDDREVAKGTKAAASHLDKFETLAGLANRLAPNLVEDEIELDRDGHTQAVRAREFAALVETLVCELYASLDGVRRTLYGAYRKVEGVQNESTKKLFERAARSKYGNTFPEEIRLALASAHVLWFSSLRQLRTELTHGDIGSCHLDRQMNRVSYFHSELGTGTRVMVVEDVVGKVNEFARNVSDLVEVVFSHLYLRLELVERRLICGIYKGRAYERLVKPESVLTFDSGRCSSKTWFEREAGLECPLQDQCGAYHRD
jgi:hypothetical protein